MNRYQQVAPRVFQRSAQQAMERLPVPFVQPRSHRILHQLDQLACGVGLAQALVVALEP